MKKQIPLISLPNKNISSLDTKQKSEKEILAYNLNQILQTEDLWKHWNNPKETWDNPEAKWDHTLMG